MREARPAAQEAASGRAQAGDSVAERAPGRVAVTLALLGVLGLLVLLGYGLFGRGPAGGGGLGVNTAFGAVAVKPRPAPGFRLPLFDGGGFDLSSARGKVVMVDFWASWCVPCREEAPVLQRVWQRYRDRDVLFVGVNTLGDKPSAARAFLERYGITYPNGQDPGAIAVEYGLTGVPEKFFIDREGQLVRKFIGPMPEAALIRELEDLLRS